MATAPLTTLLRLLRWFLMEVWISECRLCLVKCRHGVYFRRGKNEGCIRNFDCDLISIIQVSKCVCVCVLGPEQRSLIQFNSLL